MYKKHVFVGFSDRDYDQNPGGQKRPWIQIPFTKLSYKEQSYYFYELVNRYFISHTIYHRLCNIFEKICNLFLYKRLFHLRLLSQSLRVGWKNIIEPSDLNNNGLYILDNRSLKPYSLTSSLPQFVDLQ